MKKSIAILLVMIAILCSFYGCGSGDDQTADTTNESSSVVSEEEYSDNETESEEAEGETESDEKDSDDTEQDEENVPEIVGTWTYIGTMSTSTGSGMTPPDTYVCSAEFLKDGTGYLNAVEDGELWELQKVTWEFSSALDDADIYSVYLEDGSELGFSYLYSTEALTVITAAGDGMMLYQRDEDNSYLPISVKATDKAIVGRWKYEMALDTTTQQTTTPPETYVIGVLCNSDGSCTMITYYPSENKVVNAACKWRFEKTNSAGNEEYIIELGDTEFDVYYSPSDDLLMMMGTKVCIGYTRE